MKDDEVYGEGNSYTAEYWQYDPRLGRRWNVDPMFAEKPWMAPYHAFSNNPILNIDPNGASDFDTHYKGENGEDLGTTNDGRDVTVTIKDENKDLFKKEFENSPSKDSRGQNNFWVSSYTKEGDDKSFLDKFVSGEFDTKNQSPQSLPIGSSQGSGSSSVLYPAGPISPGGPLLLALGSKLRFLKPVGALGSSPGSSVASYTFSKLLPQRLTQLFGKQTGTWLAGKVGTNTLGRVLGRTVPYLGTAWLGWDTGWYLGENYGVSTWIGIRNKPIDWPDNSEPRITNIK